MTQTGQALLAQGRTNRIGYLGVVLVNAAGLLVLHVWPGWQEFTFLTADTRSVLGIVDAALVVGIVVNLLLLFRDPPWPTAAGSLVTTLVGLAAMVRLWQVFPFDVSDTWETVLRVVFVVGLVGACLGVLALLVSLFRMRQVARR
ncbi:hypothetical protein GCM10023328_11830 [Modestobacter marinus]|uniref:Uncharacterized protein n=1 Tax=Modestobacter marinus TaxID=477641 RepID=A0A846LSD4_9ACTN|nr:hypothetical protein [Modestobacter marinus]NIH69182.1 hypothetical protein [Modestobacter marinus]GGL76870.1 hypothetical protein GCM10011589_36180 [Modestobacter marinus]